MTQPSPAMTAKKKKLENAMKELKKELKKKEDAVKDAAKVAAKSLELDTTRIDLVRRHLAKRHIKAGPRVTKFAISSSLHDSFDIAMKLFKEGKLDIATVFLKDAQTDRFNYLSMYTTDDAYSYISIVSDRIDALLEGIEGVLASLPKKTAPRTSTEALAEFVKETSARLAHKKAEEAKVAIRFSEDREVYIKAAKEAVPQFLPYAIEELLFARPERFPFTAVIRVATPMPTNGEIAEWNALGLSDARLYEWQVEQDSGVPEVKVTVTPQRGDGSILRLAYTFQYTSSV